MISLLLAVYTMILPMLFHCCYGCGLPSFVSFYCGFDENAGGSFVGSRRFSCKVMQSVAVVFEIKHLTT